MDINEALDNFVNKHTKRAIASNNIDKTGCIGIEERTGNFYKIDYDHNDDYMKSNEIVFNAISTSYVSSAPLGDSYFVVNYRNDNGFGTSRIGYFTGDSIKWVGDEIVFNSASTGYPSASPLGDSYFVVSYTDGGNSNHGTSRVLKISRTFFAGLAGDSANAGDSFLVYYNGIVNGYSNINAGATYYLDYTDGSLTTTETDTKVGIAIGDTELLIRRY